MAIINGTAGDDNPADTQEDDVVYLYGGKDQFTSYYGNDIVYGGGGDDNLVTGGGSDRLYGGGGDDALGGERIYYHSNDTILLDGGDGNDGFWFTLSNGSNVTALGGAGEDRFYLSGYGNGSVVFVADGGEGNDYFLLELERLQYDLTLGSGQDTIELRVGYGAAELADTVIVADFETGALGDRIDFDSILQQLSSWDTYSNPFVDGYVRVVQSGDDALFQVDLELTGTWMTVVTLKGVATADLTYHNLGYAMDGAPVPGETWNGTEAGELHGGGEFSDTLNGLGGNDSLYGYAGDDLIRGGAGSDLIDGGEGDDTLYGEGGNDHIETGLGNDRAFGGGGDDGLVMRTQGYVSGSFETLLDGGDGNDSLLVDMGGAHTVTMRGGAGSDTFDALMYSDGTVIIDAGADDDIVNIRTDGSYTVTLGDGSDTVRFIGHQPSAYFSVPAVFTDFDASTGGDTVDLTTMWDGIRQGYDLPDNPFQGGFFRLMQEGGDTLLQFSEQGGATPGAYITFAIFQNTDVASFNYDNLGHSPDGSEPLGIAWNGTASGETYHGTFGTDTLTGLGGNDVLYGYQSADVIDGGDGNDRIEGGSGADRLFGGAGDDIIRDYGTGWGDDYIDAGAGNDSVDIQYGTSGPGERLTVLLGGGNDSLIVRSSYADANYVYGGAGDDDIFYTGRHGFVDLDGGGGNDHLTLVLWGSDYRLTLGAGQDTIELYEQTEWGSYADRIVVTDFETGDLGDTFDFAAFIAGYRFSVDASDPFRTQGMRLVQDGDDALLQLVISGTPGSFETLAVLEGVDIGTVTGTHNFGWDPGTLSFYGSEAGDTLKGLWGNNSMYGYAGDDTMSGQAGDDTIFGGDGFDSLSGQVGNDTLDGGADDDFLNGGKGDDTLIGGTGNDELFSWLGDNHFDGGDGDDKIIGGGGIDTAFGGLGDDIIRAKAGDDELHGGAGADSMSGGWGEDLMYGDDGDDTMNGEGNVDTMYGGLGNDFMRGGDGADSLHGEDGDDFIEGGNANDAIYGGAGGDKLFGEAGHDTIEGGDGADRIYGGFGDDMLFGDGGWDVIDGGDGHDILLGGAGSDTLAGGAGMDVFIFNTALGAGNVDTITDFNVSEDGIVLDRDVFAGIAQSGVLSASAFHEGSSAADASDRIIYNKTTGEIFYDADGSGGGASVLFAKVTAGTQLSAANFEAYYLQQAAEAPKEAAAASLPDLQPVEPLGLDIFAV